VSTVARLPGISAFLPSHNEEANVERVVQGYVCELPRIADDFEVIVVDDGSRDRTGEIADRLAAARMPYVLLSDGDGQFDPAEVAKLAAFMPEYDVVAGYRARRADHLGRRINGAAWTMLVRMLLGITIGDIDCGFKLFKREFLDGMELKARGAMISTELMARLAGRGAKVREVEVTHLPRTAGEQSGANLRVVARAFKELFALYADLRAERRRAAGAA
jgi:glycosyltransferase involved in cell wall biosynthesis